MKQRYLIIKEYEDYRREPKYFTVDADREEVTKKIISKLKQEHIKNVGEFVVCKFFHSSLYIWFLKDGIPKEYYEFTSGDISWVTYKQLTIIKQEFDKQLKES